MTATSTENVPRYSSTSRNAQLLSAQAAHSHPHSIATKGISHECEALCLRVFQAAGRLLGVWMIISISANLPMQLAAAANHPLPVQSFRIMSDKHSQCAE